MVEGVADKLPYEDNTFDIVACVQSFHHYPDPDKAMLEAYRVLKPGGRYILSDTGLGGVGGWFYNHLLLPLMKSGDCNTTNKDGIVKRMEKNVFHVQESYNLTKTIYTVIGRKL